MATFGDPRVDRLAEIYMEAALELEQLLGDLLISQTHGIRTYSQILRIIQDLKSRTSYWVRTEIENFFLESDRITFTTLGLDPAQFPPVNQDAVRSLVFQTSGYFDAALNSVELLASKVFRKTGLPPDLQKEVQDSIASGMAGGKGIQSLNGISTSILKKSFKDGIVRLIDSSGSARRFSLDYYGALVSHQTLRQANTVATLLRANEFGHDLVLVSPNPSTIGDYCDEYKGKVFSISGTSDIYPALSSTPNGGPPFHPWCKHSISVFVDTFYSAEEMESFVGIDPTYLLLPGEENHNRIIKEWNRSHQ